MTDGDHRFRLPTAIITFLLAILFVPSSLLAESKLTVYTVNYPLQYFAERIGGEYVEVVFPVPGDVDPAYWMPEAKTISAYQSADVVLLNGAGYAKWVGKVSLPRSRMVDTSRSFRDSYIESSEVTTHSHGPKGKHAHESLAFTTWIDLSLATRQAKAVAQALGRKSPQDREVFENNYRELEKDLLDLDNRITEMVKKHSGKPLIVSHPVYDYWARGYKLNIRSVHWEPDEKPSTAQWMELKRLLEEHPARWMVWEGDPDPAVGKRLEELGVSSLVFNPCSNVPKSGDFLSVMKTNVEKLRAVFP